MRKAFLYGSISCVLVGLICITYGYYFDPSFIGALILLVLYFVVTAKVFVLALTSDLKEKLASGEIYCAYEKRFWVSIAAGVTAAMISGVVYFRMIENEFGSAFILTLGLAAIFTAFIKPKVLHDGKTDDTREFG